MEEALELMNKVGISGLEKRKITEVSGNLTDHYDPTKKVVRLSAAIHDGTSIASLAVAASVILVDLSFRKSISLIIPRPFVTIEVFKA